MYFTALFRIAPLYFSLRSMRTKGLPNVTVLNVISSLPSVKMDNLQWWVLHQHYVVFTGWVVTKQMSKHILQVHWEHPKSNAATRLLQGHH